MKLTICVPTHHGRREYLEQLIDSALRQRPSLDGGDELRFCISDNASEDGTAQLIADYQRDGGAPFKYHRFEKDMRGVINTTNVIEMADTEYCWLMGSDDVLLEGGLARVFATLKANPTIAGLTVNKLNFDHSLTTLLGPDGSVVLPKDPTRQQTFSNWKQTVEQLGLDFGYMSSHVVRRESWRAVVAQFGIPYLKTLRHFSHTFMFCEIAKCGGAWMWMPEYCVAQRHGNSCVVEEHGNRESIRTLEEAEDYEKVYLAVLGADARKSPEFRSLMYRLFLAYWNPFKIRDFQSEPAMSPADARKLRAIARRLFYPYAAFWLLSYPLLCLPRSIVRHLHPSKLLRRRRAPAPSSALDEQKMPPTIDWTSFGMLAERQMSDLRARSITTALFRMLCRS